MAEGTRSEDVGDGVIFREMTVVSFVGVVSSQANGLT